MYKNITLKYNKNTNTYHYYIEDISLPNFYNDDVVCYIQELVCDTDDWYDCYCINYRKSLNGAIPVYKLWYRTTNIERLMSFKLKFA